jgi:hypothetical protein
MIVEQVADRGRETISLLYSKSYAESLNCSTFVFSYTEGWQPARFGGNLAGSQARVRSCGLCAGLTMMS